MEAPSFTSTISLLYQTMKRKILVFTALVVLIVAGVATGVYIGSRTRDKANLPTISRRAGEASASTEFLNAERAVRYYHAQLQAHPGVVKNYTELAQLFLQEARITGNHHEYIPKAQQLLKTALTLDSNDLHAQLGQASLLMTLHHFSKAKAVAERCVQAYPYNATGYGILCDALVELGLYSQAVQIADKMVALRPDLRSYSRVAYLREIHGDIDGALVAMKLAADAGVRGTEQRSWTLYQLGLLLLQKNAVADAERLFKGILEERPHYPYALGGLSMIAALRSEWFEAVNLLIEASHRCSDHGFIEQLAGVYRAMQEHDVAGEFVKKALEAFAQHEREGWNIRREYAAFCLKHDIYLTESLAQAEQDYKSRPTNIDALSVYAFALYKNNRPYEALRLIEQALQVSSRHPLLCYHAALICAAAGQQERSKELLKHLTPAMVVVYGVYAKADKSGAITRSMY
jgi:tetratricopeptide (TPR) repeat protein